MAVGYLSMGECHETAAKVIDAYYSSQPAMSFSTPNGLEIVNYFTKINGSWFMTVLRNDGSTGNRVLPTTNVYGTCEYVPNANTYSYTDAAAMWGFAFSMTLMLWYLSVNLGQILAAIKRW